MTRTYCNDPVFHLGCGCLDEIEMINRELADASESSTSPDHRRLENAPPIRANDQYAWLPRDAQGHRARFSDSSLYDFVCVDCGATDGMGDNSLARRCPNA